MLDMADMDKLMTLAKDWADKYGDILNTKVSLSHFIWLSSPSVVKDPMDEPTHHGQRAPLKTLNLETSSSYMPVQDFESKQVVWKILHASDDWRYRTNTIMTIIYGQPSTTPGACMIDTVPMLADLVPHSLLQNWKKVARQWYEEKSQIYFRMFNKLVDDVKNGTAPVIKAESDGTTTALSNVILAFLLYPEVVQGVHKELDRVVGQERMPTFSDDINSPTFTDPGLRDHFTFGAGRRNCPGLQFAHNSLFINIARIIWAFDIRKFACHFEPRSERHTRIIDETWHDAQQNGLAGWRHKQAKIRSAWGA
ncbi:hypothetical protein VTI74DRAFT_8329 [Chaetomium olivicolor]